MTKQLRTIWILLFLSLSLGCTTQTPIMKHKLPEPASSLVTLPAKYIPGEFKTTGDLLDQRDTYKEQYLLIYSQLEQLINWFSDIRKQNG